MVSANYGQSQPINNQNIQFQQPTYEDNNNYYNEMNKYYEEFQKQNQQIIEQQQHLANQFNEIATQLNTTSNEYNSNYNLLQQRIYGNSVVNPQSNIIQTPSVQIPQNYLNKQYMNNTAYMQQQQPQYINNFAHQQQQQRLPQSARPAPYHSYHNYNYNNINYSSTANLLNRLQDESIQQEQIKIIPQPNERNNLSYNKIEEQNKKLQNEWIKQIEDKKRRESEQKQKEIEKDRELEEKWKKQMTYQNEIKQQIKQGKIKLDNFSPSPGNEFAMMSYIHNPDQQINNINNNIENNNNNNNENSLSEINQDLIRNYSNQNIKSISASQSQNNLNLSNIKTPQPSQYSQNTFNFQNACKRIEDNIYDQLAELRSNVTNQYVTMGDIFGKLKHDVVEAHQLKREAEKECTYIKDELLKHKMNNVISQIKMKQPLEKEMHYNNSNNNININNIPYNELEDISISESVNKNKNLQSVSAHVYLNDNNVYESNANYEKEYSGFAKLGQSLMNESELIPIPSSNDVNTNNNSGMVSKRGVNKINMNTINEEVKSNSNYHNNSMDFKELNSELEHIEILNQQLNMGNNIKRENNNLDLEYTFMKNDRKHQEEIKAMEEALYSDNNNNNNNQTINN